MSSRHSDYILLSVSIILMILGLSALSSVSAIFSQEKFGSPTFYLFRQIIMGIIPGIILGFAAFKIPLEFLKRKVSLILLANLVFMVLVFVPNVGVSLSGAKRWVDLVFVSFQPSEFLKLSFILYLSAWLSKKEVKINTPKSFGKNFHSRFIKPQLSEITSLDNKFLPFLAIIGFISLLLIFQPDVSTLGIIFLVGFIMYFVAEGRILYSFFIIAMAISALFLLINTASYRLNRWLTFLNPGIEPMGKSYQIIQALITVGSGGIWGLGLGMSVQRFGFLPQPMSDSIFAIFSEETGFLGALTVILLFLIFFWRGVEISKQSQDRFSKLAALGISCWIILQTFVNISSIIGILPLMGIPLPFFSYGGSALVAELIGVGILLNISKQI